MPPRPSPRLVLRLPALAGPGRDGRRVRPYSVAAATTAAGKSVPPPPPPPPRWISELRGRIGKCIIFGCSPQQVSRAGTVLNAIAAEWRELLAGSEGFLTGTRGGLDGQRVAWGEMDSFGHVNNVTYYRYAESARVNWITNFAVHVDPAHRQEWADSVKPGGVGLIMGSLKADFKFVSLDIPCAGTMLEAAPMVYPDTISVYHKLRSRPEADPAPTSFILDCLVLSHQHQRPAARLVENLVIYDYEKAGRAEMPAFMQDVFNDTYTLQEKETVRARARIWDLIKTVEELEKETWDREDAVEDLGSAAAAKKP
ncbi:hypothetical protein GQ53DRAFT_671824 [Thozetella sp. PMI_491]|nr:hypothetical protein GQ53DRAFT_671824 [Thozetella sp. PMI_491]